MTTHPFTVREALEHDVELRKLVDEVVRRARELHGGGDGDRVLVVIDERPFFRALFEMAFARSGVRLDDSDWPSIREFIVERMRS